MGVALVQQGRDVLDGRRNAHRVGLQENCVHARVVDALGMLRDSFFGNSHPVMIKHRLSLNLMKRLKVR